MDSYPGLGSDGPAMSDARVPPQWSRSRGSDRFVRGGNVAGRDFREADLSGMRLQEILADHGDFSAENFEDFRCLGGSSCGARFEGAFFATARFHDVLLNGACFDAAQFASGSLATCSLRESRFVGADLRRANLSGADFSGADLTDAVLKGVEAKGVIFRNACLFRADFSGADLSGAVFLGADLRSVKWQGTKLDGAQFDPGAHPQA